MRSYTIFALILLLCGAARPFVLQAGPPRKVRATKTKEGGLMMSLPRGPKVNGAGECALVGDVASFGNETYRVISMQ